MTRRVTLDKKSFSLIAVVAAILPVLVGQLVLAAPAAALQSEPKVTEIVINGNRNLNREAIIGMSGLKIGDVVTQALLDSAKRRLVQTEYFGGTLDDPDTAVKVVAQIEGSNARVVIDVVENDLIKSINITGTGPVAAADIKALLSTKEGTVLNMNTLRGDATRIQDTYKAKGYQGAVGDIQINNGVLDIPIVVARVNTVKITGLKKTHEYVVAREMRLKKGSYFSSSQFEKDFTRVYNTNLFADVSPSIGATGPGLVDINLNVEEKRTANAAITLGYSSRNRLVGGAELGDMNFLGRGQQLNLRWDTGGLANRNSTELSFAEPWLDSKQTSLTASVYDKTVYRFSQNLASTGTTDTSNSDYYEVHSGAQFSIGRPLTEQIKGSFGLRYDNVHVPKLTLNPSDSAALQNGPVVVASLRGSRNTRDIDNDPSKGGLDSATLEIGHANIRPAATADPTAVSGNLSFEKLQLEARRYIGLGAPRKKLSDKRKTIALRLLGGFTAGTPPFFEQFFAGGAESLRGYNEDRFWGKNMLLASAEFRAPLANSLTGVVFVDAGDAWGGAYEKIKFNDFVQHSGFSPSVGFGVGLRVVTPIGPIRIDQGFGSEGGRTHFSIGHVF